jgi:predicted MPP superfamily phosphohydrolase
MEKCLTGSMEFNKVRQRLNQPVKFTRRQFFAAGGVALAGAGYGIGYEPRNLQVTNTQIPVDSKTFKHPLKVLLLADLHESLLTPLDLIADAVDLGLAQKPDLILLPGDFITGKRDNFIEYGKVLGRLALASPTFATLGNHDGGGWASEHGGYSDSLRVQAFLEGCGITTLKNDNRKVDVNGQTVMVVGIDDPWSGTVDPGKAFKDVNKADYPVIVASHNPDSKELLGANQWDLMCSGHTHGGQGISAFAPVHDKRFVEGLCKNDKGPIYVTRGIGSFLGIRINCPPEIAILDCVPA